MGEITTIEDLREALDLSNLEKDERLEDRFEKIAKALLTEFAIKKGKQLFYITDIEFYYYADDHKDFITYPRECEAGEWFFHPSGVDIAFKSHVKFEFVNEEKNTQYRQYRPVLDASSKFGGILIRSIIPANEKTEKALECDAKCLIDHPLNVSDFLFDHFDAFEAPKDDRFPVLVKCEPHAKLPSPCKRYIKIKDIDKKFENIKKYNYARFDIEDDTLKTEFIKYLPETGREKESVKLRYTTL